jgi:hypothetical protein
MAKRSALRASDADRDRVAERLRQAVTEGRLLAHEFEDRLARTLRARTYGDLDAVVEDLPSAATPSTALVTRRASRLQLAGRHPFAAAGLLVLGAVVMTAVLAATVAVALMASVVFLVLRGQGSRHDGHERPLRQYSHSGRFQEAQHVLTNARRYGRF